MFLKSELDIFDLCRSMPFEFNNIVEVGVASWKECRTKAFIEDGRRVAMFEPHPEYYNDLQSKCGEYDNVTLHNLAISDKEGELTLALRGQGSFLIDELPTSPVLSDRYDGRPFQKITVKTDTFDKYDDGNIDLLLLDMEGAEWFVLDRLKSRPRIIAVETHHENRYTNPFINEINNFMNRNVYKVLFRNTADTFFIYGGDLGWGAGGNDNWRL